MLQRSHRRVCSDVFSLPPVALVAAVVVSSGLGRAQVCGLDLASVSLTGAGGNGDSNRPALSADGRFVAFRSAANNLVPGDTNSLSDVFVRDRLLGTTTRVSHVTGGTAGNAETFNVSISNDGRYVCFDSQSTALVAGDTNNRRDCFVHDTQTGVTSRVSLGETGNQGTSDSYGILSGDGTKVLFFSESNNLVTGDTNVLGDLFLRDLVAGTTVRVNLDNAGNQTVGGSTSFASLTSDGRYLLFNSNATNLRGCWLRDMTTGLNERIDVAHFTNTPSTIGGAGRDVSDDGRYVVFESSDANLVLGDTNLRTDIFLRDRLLLETRRISISSTGQQSNLPSSEPRISLDGRTVVFGSSATNLVAGDLNGWRDIFAYDVHTRETRLASFNYLGGQITADAVNEPAVDGTGNTVVFISDGDGIVPTHTGGTGIDDAYVMTCSLSRVGTFCGGTALNCPCGNAGGAGRGCANSVNATGGLLTVFGGPDTDDVVLEASGVPNVASCIFLQGDLDVGAGTEWGGVVFGDGNRCVGGNLKRLALRNASGGTCAYPQAGDPTLSARSAALGDPLLPGSARIYQVYYRNASPTFCAEPVGGTFNVTNAASVVW